MGEAEKLMAPAHPGEILREDFMKPMGLSVNKLALELHMPATRIGEIVHERRRITAETALRLARYWFTVFNIKGNAYRLITEINYQTGRVFLRYVLTHAEYSKGAWR